MVCSPAVWTKWFRFAAPVPPLPTAKVPVTPGETAAVPLKLTADVLARLVWIALVVANAVAVPASPDVFWFKVGIAAQVKPPVLPDCAVK